MKDLYELVTVSGECFCRSPIGAVTGKPGRPLKTADEISDGIAYQTLQLFQAAGMAWIRKSGDLPGVM